MTTKHVVGFSGGIDSQTCAGWVLERFPARDVILLNSQAGRNEHPLTVEHVAWYSQHVHPVVEIVPLIRDLGDVGTRCGKTGERRREFSESAEMDFRALAYIKGRFPSRKAQFCTEYLKLAPQLRWMRENLYAHGVDAVRYIGVRADESGPRSALPESEWDEYFDCQLERPLLRWSKQQCFDVCARRGEQINPLYKMGFGRVGCAPCINSSKNDIREWSDRFPEMIDKLRGWEAKNGRTFFAPCVPGMALNFVDDVVQWAHTERGGKQLSLPFASEESRSGGCSSKYGLCE